LIFVLSHETWREPSFHNLAGNVFYPIRRRASFRISVKIADDLNGFGALVQNSYAIIGGIRGGQHCITHQLVK
jgi:hypothetical protein